MRTGGSYSSSRTRFFIVVVVAVAGLLLLSFLRLELGDEGGATTTTATGTSAASSAAAATEWTHERLYRLAQSRSAAAAAPASGGGGGDSSSPYCRNRRRSRRVLCIVTHRGRPQQAEQLVDRLNATLFSAGLDSSRLPRSGGDLSWHGLVDYVVVDNGIGESAPSAADSQVTESERADSIVRTASRYASVSLSERLRYPHDVLAGLSFARGLAHYYGECPLAYWLWAEGALPSDATADPLGPLASALLRDATLAGVQAPLTHTVWPHLRHTSDDHRMAAAAAVGSDGGGREQDVSGVWTLDAGGAPLWRAEFLDSVAQFDRDLSSPTLHSLETSYLARRLGLRLGLLPHVAPVDTKMVVVQSDEVVAAFADPSSPPLLTNVDRHSDELLSGRYGARWADLLLDRLPAALGRFTNRPGSWVPAPGFGLPLATADAVANNDDDDDKKGNVSGACGDCWPQPWQPPTDLCGHVCNESAPPLS